MSRSTILLTLAWLAAMAIGSPLALGEEPASSGRRSLAPSSAPQRAPSSTYYVFKAPTEARQAPDRSAPVAFVIASESQALKALGMASDGDQNGTGAGDHQPSGAAWIKVKAASGSIGFVERAELITPQQLEAKKQSIKKLGMLEAEVETVRRAKSSPIPAGVYSLGGSCDPGFGSHIDTIAFLNTKVLVWQEADKLHFVHVLDPLAPVVYEPLNDVRTVELQGFGYVPMKTFRSEQDTALMGFKDNLLWFTASGTQFDNYQLCAAGTEGTVLSLVRTYAAQRPPE